MQERYVMWNKAILHKSYMQSILSYKAECWVMRVEDEEKMKTIEMKVLPMLFVKTLEHDMSNEMICKMTRVKSIEELL